MPSPPRSKDPANALRSALLSPWPELRTAARRILKKARKTSWGATAEALGVGRRSLERLRAEFPDIYPENGRE
jgi:hypothetical protein